MHSDTSFAEFLRFLNNGPTKKEPEEEDIDAIVYHNSFLLEIGRKRHFFMLSRRKGIVSELIIS